MIDVLFLSVILLILVGAMGFYFYSRLSYTDKRINLLESILLDIKMTMEMETDNHVKIQPPLKEPEPFEPEDSEELKDDSAAMYTSVIESAASAPSDRVVISVPDYESMSREELTALAERRSLRVTKSMKKVSIVNLLRETDRVEATGAEATLSTEGSSGGAALVSETLEADTLSS